MTQPAWILYDLGGVLVRLSGVDEFGSLIGATDEEEIWHTWLHCEWVKRFERGQCSAEAFAAGMVEQFRMELAPAKFLERFRAWPDGLHERALHAVEGLNQGLQRACLSNSNVVHWDECMTRLGLGELFPVRFLSHEMGAVKPDAKAFHHVLQALDVPPEQVLFLDDNQINVDAARQAGIDAHRTRDADEAIALLHERGLHPG